MVVTRAEVRPVLVDERLMVCPPGPEVPAPPITQRNVALFVVELDEAHATCRASMAAVRARTAQLRAQFGDPAE